MDNYLSKNNNMKEILYDFGVCIVESVLDESYLKIMTDGMWENLEQLTKNLDIPLKRDDTETYKQISKIGIKNSMLIQNYGIGHTEDVWKIRTNPNVLKVFSEIWKTDELVTSFDGVSYNIQSTIKKPMKNQIKYKLHCDQSFLRNDLECFQTWVTGYDVNEGYGTLLVLEGSHKYHKECQEHFKITTKDDWLILTEEQIDWYINVKKCKKTPIICKAGSMVLWDSRTIHCGMPPQIKQTVPRCIIYMCMIPKANCSNVKKKKRIKAFEEGRMTTHNPSKIRIFPENPHTYGKPQENIVKLERVIVNDKIKNLIGYII